MKVIIVEVTRAANTFGLTHLSKIRDAYAQIAGDRRPGAGRRRCSVPRSHPSSPRRRSTAASSRSSPGGSSKLEPVSDEELERAKTLIVETICRGLEG